MAELAPGQRLDQYEIVGEFARGGMATLYRAIDHETGRTVVLKVPHLQFESDIAFHERFLREEAIGQRLDHPAIVKVLTPKSKSRMYLAMEYVQGQPLREWLKHTPQLPIDTAVALAIQIADALVYLHAHDVVHRDLKPENIMITPYERVKLMDFGIALDTTQRKLTWGKLSQTFGTPDYMAPEQLKGQRGDARTDIYSLGAILYEMLTGVVPFPHDNVYASMHAKGAEDPTPPRQIRPEIPPALEETVLHALERDPAKRQESAFQLREELAHPDSVIITGRAARQPDTHRLSTGARTWLTVVGWAAAGAAFILGFVVLVHVLR